MRLLITLLVLTLLSAGFAMSIGKVSQQNINQYHRKVADI